MTPILDLEGIKEFIDNPRYLRQRMINFQNLVMAEYAMTLNFLPDDDICLSIKNFIIIS